MQSLKRPIKFLNITAQECGKQAGPTIVYYCTASPCTLWWWWWVGDRKQIIHSFVDREQQYNKNNINTQQQQFRSWAGMILYTLQPGGRDICWCSTQHTKKQYEQQTKAKQN